MKPRIGYYYSMRGVTRFEFTYPDVNGYENWIWTDFDLNLIGEFHSKSKSSYACHLNQPKQPTGLSFFKKLSSIFENLIEIEIPVESDLPADNWWYKTINKLFSTENENIFFCCEITDMNMKDSFFSHGDIGCFWYIFFLEDDRGNELFHTLKECGISSDKIIFNDKLKFVIFRDYIKNSVSIVVSDANRAIVDEYVSKAKIFMKEKHISNIFDASYLDDLHSKKVNQ